MFEEINFRNLGIDIHKVTVAISHLAVSRVGRFFVAISNHTVVYCDFCCISILHSYLRTISHPKFTYSVNVVEIPVCSYFNLQ